MSRREPCDVVDPLCLAAPLEPRRTTMTCFACGLPACSNCSVQIPWRGYGRQRVCHRCLRDRRDPGDLELVAQHLRTARR